MSDDVIISKHINHTNNTLIFGRLNGNAGQGIPSLSSAIVGQENLGTVIETIFNGDDNQRLSVSNIGDVVRLFKPSYYFSVSQERVDGIDTNVVEHSLKFRPNTLPVELTSESLSFKLLSSNGRLDLSDLIADLRADFRKGRDAHIAAAKSRNPARKTKEKEMRSELVSRLIEPVTAYLILAESTQRYDIIEPEIADGSDLDSPAGGPPVLLPVLINNEWRLERQYLKPVASNEVELDMDEQVEQECTKSRTALLSDIRQGRALLASAVNGIFKSTKDESSLTEPKKLLLGALISSGVAGEIMIDDLTEDKTPATHTLLIQANDQYLEDKPHLLIEDKATGQEPVEIANPSTTAVATQVRSTKMLCQRMRQDLAVDNLNDNINRIEQHALAFYREDDAKQNKIATYLHTLTPSGQIENQLVELQNQPKGASAVRGMQGYRLYIDLCLEEAAQRSALVEKSLDLFRRILLEQPHQIQTEHESKWQQFHDHLLQTAKATFEDYIEVVSPLTSRLKGIDAFLQTAMKGKERKPHVLIANNALEDILDDESLREQFIDLMRAMNSVTQEALERAVSIVITPGMAEFYKEQIFKIGYKVGFSTFLTPEEPVEFNDLNETTKLKQLVNDWSSNENKDYQSGVLCVPDNVLLPHGFRFKLGEYLSTHKLCIYELDRPIVVPACFNAAALVARNDDTRFVKEMLRTNRLLIEDSWPSIGLRFGKQQYDPIWVDETLSQGVILEENILQNLPLCIFEHSKDHNGRLKRIRIRQLNTLCTIGHRPLPVHEFRAGRYLNRVLRLNCRRGAKPAKIGIFCNNMRGIYREGYDNSILDGQDYELKYNEKGGYISIRNKSQDLIVTDFPVESEEAATQEA